MNFGFRGHCFRSGGEEPVLVLRGDTYTKMSSDELHVWRDRLEDEIFTLNCLKAAMEKEIDQRKAE